MKKSLGILLAAVAVGAVLLGSGCVTDGIANVTTRPVSTLGSVTNTVVQTNVVTVTNLVSEVKKDQQGGFVTNLVEKTVVVTNTIPVFEIRTVTNTVYETKPAITSGLKVGQSIAPFLPPPFGEIVMGVLGVASAGLGAVAAAKNKQANNLTSQLTAVVHGVEQATSAIDPKIGEQVKNAIATTSKVLGVQEDLNTTVQKLTS